MALTVPFFIIKLNIIQTKRNIIKFYIPDPTSRMQTMNKIMLHNIKFQTSNNLMEKITNGYVFTAIVCLEKQCITMGNDLKVYFSSIRHIVFESLMPNLILVI